MESGQPIDIFSERIVQKKAEHAELEKQLAEETMQYPVVTVPQVKFFFDRFKKGDISDPKYRKSLVDTFVRKVILYDDKMTILYNIQDGQSSLSLEPECFSKDQLVELALLNPNPNPCRLKRLPPGSARQSWFRLYSYMSVPSYHHKDRLNLQKHLSACF